jgi:serine/threonine protein kinase
MGEVWRGERVGPGGVRRRAAIKRILPEHQGDHVLRERFIAEARITARLEHPNIVQVLDFGDTPELYLILEYVEGLPLAEVMRRAAIGQGSLPWPATLHIVAEAATGLDYAHRRTDDAGSMLNIVHRDVSPPNILLSSDGAVKVSDFGIARAADNMYRTQQGQAVGKLVYMSPEQVHAGALDRRTDVFALGVVLWEALTLRPLIPRNNHAAALMALTRGNFPPPSSIVPNLPPGVDAIVAEALTVDVSRRTPSAGRLADSLRTVIHSYAPGFDSRALARVFASIAPDMTFRSSAPMTSATPQVNMHAGAPVPVNPAPVLGQAGATNVGAAFSHGTGVTKPIRLEARTVPTAKRSSDEFDELAATRVSEPEDDFDKIAQTRVSFEEPYNPNVGRKNPSVPMGLAPTPMAGAPMAGAPMPRPSVTMPPPTSRPSLPFPAPPAPSTSRGLHTGLLIALFAAVFAIAVTAGFVARHQLKRQKNLSANQASSEVAQLLSVTLPGVARSCANSAGMISIPGSAMVQIGYQSSGQAELVQVQVQVSTPSAANEQISRCIESNVRSIGQKPADGPYSVGPLRIPF